MLKQIRINLAFEDEDPQGDIVEEVLRHIDSAIVIQEGEINEERGYVELLDNNHNNPNQPCNVTARWEVGRGKVI